MADTLPQDDTAATGIDTTDGFNITRDPTGTPVDLFLTFATLFADADFVAAVRAAIPTVPYEIVLAVSDETTALTTGTGKLTFRMPRAMTLTSVNASLTTASSSGVVTVDINEAGSTILSTKLTVDASEKTSTTAATAAVISDAALAADAEMTIDIDTAGTGAAGLKVYLIGTAAL